MFCYIKFEYCLDFINLFGLALDTTDRYRYRGEVEKGKRADIYLEARKRRGHTFF
jgi:hypothetical protein